MIDPVHFLRSADDIFGIRRTLHHFLERVSLLGRVGEFYRVFHTRLHFGNFERLADVVTRTFSNGFLSDLLVTKACHQDDFAIFHGIFDPPQNFKSVNFTHLDVRDDELRCDVLQLFQSLRAVDERKCFVTEFFAGGDDEFDDVRFVVNDDDFCHG